MTAWQRFATEPCGNTMTERVSSAAMPDRPLLYSVEEAARQLGIGRTFMFHLIATGEIDSLKIGKRRKIPADALAAYVQRLRADQPTAMTGNGSPSALKTPRSDPQQG